MTTVVMYHYVRDTEGTQFPGLHVRNNGEFVRQLDHLHKHFDVIDIDQLRKPFDSPTSKPRALLTFDDGFKDHFTNVLPNLKRFSFTGAFYVPAAPLIAPVILDVHKIQVLLGSQLFEDLFLALVDLLGTRLVEDYAESGATENEPEGLDPQKILLFKRLLQRDLPQPQRSEVLNLLFQRFFPGEEKGISEALYLSLTELRELKKQGMHVGNHTVNHPWLGYVDPSEAISEISRCEDLLVAEGLMDESFKTIAFPFGNSSPHVIEYLETANYGYAFSTVVAEFDPETDHRLGVPRLDTNDLPH
jgi:peptidoglycan/xylan/chitin deacetylase (PgdA/CDA1 family)